MSDEEDNSAIDVETSVLRGYDTDDPGYVLFKRDLGTLLQKIRQKKSAASIALKKEEETEQNLSNNSQSDDGISIISFHSSLNTMERQAEFALDQVDPKAVVLLQSLLKDCYKYQNEGNYLEASRTNEKLQILKSQEEERLLQIVRQRHADEKAKLEHLHNQQYADFCLEWDKFLNDFDEKAALYLREMTAKHDNKMQELQQALEKEVRLKPHKWSRELIEWRKRQNVLVGQQSYLEAQRVKDVSDALEKTERGIVKEGNRRMLEKRVGTLRQQQLTERQNALKRIKMRRMEHNEKKRHADCNRLLQRNINIQNAMKSRHIAESATLLAAVKEKIRVALSESNHSENSKGTFY